MAVADDANAAYYNPAGLATLSRAEITAMHAQWFQGLSYNYGAFALPLERGTVALSAATLEVDDIERHADDESDQGRFSNLNGTYGLSYGFNLGPLTSFGVTGRYLQEKIDAASASAWAADAGVLRRFQKIPVTLGLAARNVGTPVKFDGESDPLPATVDAGASMPFFKQRLRVAVNVLKSRDQNMTPGFGAEWAQELGERFRYAVRGGYNSAGTDANGTTGIALGGGLGYERLDIDFAWVPFGELGNTFRYAARFRF